MARKKKQEQKPALPQKFWVLAADLSLRRPGFCKMLVTNGDEPELENVETISVDNKNNDKSHGQLLDEIMKAFAFFVPEDGIPIWFVRERAFNARAAQSEIGIYKVVGVMDWLLYRLAKDWLEIYPVTVKKLVTGSGKATKEEVAKTVQRFLPSAHFGTDDESDAAAVAISFLVQNGVLKVSEEKDGCIQQPAT